MTLDRTIHRQSREPKDRQVMPGEALANDLWCAGIFQGGRAETVEAQNCLAVRFGNGQECLGGALVMTLAGVSSEELIEGRLAAVKRRAIVLFGNRLFTPVGQAHDPTGTARAAFRNFALGAGGFSRRSNTRRLSRRLSLTR